jgi:hypothetical protein
MQVRFLQLLKYLTHLKRMYHTTVPVDHDPASGRHNLRKKLATGKLALIDTS